MEPITKGQINNIDNSISLWLKSKYRIQRYKHFKVQGDLIVNNTPNKCIYHYLNQYTHLEVHPSANCQMRSADLYL